jgi:peptidoglycan/LPS O-acetylase OafA/YrhL
VFLRFSIDGPSDTCETSPPKWLCCWNDDREFVVYRGVKRFSRSHLLAYLDLGERVPQQIRPLTGVRGLAALWVVFLHLNGIDNNPVRGLLGNVVDHGYLAVDLFFVLSGFVMSLSYKQLFESGSSLAHYATFLIRRLARIYPLYFVTTVLITVLAVSGIDHHHISTNGLALLLFFNLTLVDSWGFAGSLNGPAWSISTEFGAYLVFPLLLSVLAKRGRITALGAGLLCLGAVNFVAMLASPTPGTPRQGPLDVYWARSVWPLVRCIAEFSIGILTYRIASNVRVRSWAQRADVGYLISAAIVGLVLIPQSDVFIVALLPGLIVSLACGTGGVAAFFGSAAMVFLGEISYAVYLLHWPMLRVQQAVYAVLARHLPHTIAAVAASLVFLAVLITVSWLVYRSFERPCRRFGRRFERLIGLQERALVVASESVGARTLVSPP